MISNSIPMLTFVVPVYNVEKYLNECLGSLLHQTKMNHRVIIVNDGSTDASAEIASKYVEQYPDVFSYVYQENQGLGAARNTGLALVDTLYVTFLDSDDWQDCHFVETFEDELSKREEQIDIVFSLPWVYDSVTHEKKEWNDKLLLNQLFYHDGGYETVPSAYITKANTDWMRMYELEASCCRRVFRTAFLKDIGYRFPVGVKWEDVWPHFLAIHHAKCCIAMRGSGFVYRVNQSSQITSSGGKTRMDIAPVFSHVIQTALTEGWADGEIAYIINILWEFSKWSITVTKTDYIVAVLDSIHKLFCDIPKWCFDAHRRWFRRKKTDRLILEMKLLQSPMYVVLRDYLMRRSINHTVERVRRVVRKFRRR